MIKVVYFDLFQTLVSATTYKITKEIARRYSFPPTFDIHVFLYETVKPLMTVNRDMEKEFFHNILAGWGRNVTDAGIDELTTFWKGRLDESRVFPEVEEVLSEISKTYELGLISNLTRHALDVFQDRFDLERFFTHPVYSCVEGVMKPNQEIFEVALNLYGVRADEAIYVGDGYQLDVESAKNAGLYALWLNRKDRLPPQDPLFKPDGEISNLWGVKPILDNLGENDE